MAHAPSGGDLAQMVREHHQAVYRYAFRLTGSVQDAEDLTQQVFLAAQRKIDQLRKMEAVRGWLFAILRNCFLRDRRRRRPALAADLGVEVDGLSRDSDNGIDGDELQDALHRLPEKSRLMLVMFYFEECSYREMAEALEMPIGTVMSRLTRAKKRLRKLLMQPDHYGRNRWCDVAAERG